jgi:hypothetical protein
MPTPTPQEATRRWLNNLSAAGETIRQGVEAVSVSPTQQAAESADRFIQGVQESVASGKWQDGLRAVSLSDWKNAFVSKLSRIPTGARSAEPKMVSFFQDFLPFVEREVSALPPRGSFEQNKARMLQMVDALHNYRRSR